MPRTQSPLLRHQPSLQDPSLLRHTTHSQTLSIEVELKSWAVLITIIW